MVDSGLARIPRFLHRSGIQRLQVESVSQASANQRAGRCGRTAPGICIRLYSEEDFRRRPEFAAPEILRTSLAGAALELIDLGIRDLSSFPFPTPPEPSMVRVALDELRELGAIADTPAGLRLTETGRRLTAMPVEPRIGRMVLAAGDARAAAQVLPVAAFLSCEDPRRHALEERDRARQAYAKFKAPASDFASILKLWLWWRQEADGLSQTRRRRLCKENYLSYRRMGEWQEVWRQLSDIASRMGIDAVCDKGGDAGFHRALLSGLLSRIGKFHDGEKIYRGARGTSFTISPASVLRRSTPPWIMAAEIVDTSRPFASTVAAIDVEWIEEAAGPLCRHAYRSPEWDPESGFVRAVEDVTLFGLPLASGRRCDFSRIDPALSRDLFIRRGIIDGDFPSPPKHLAAVIDAISAIRSAAAKSRRRELFDEDALAAHLDAALPPGLCSAPALRKWLAAAPAAERRRLAIDTARWLPADLPDDADFPDAITVAGCRFALEYRDEGGDGDGVTCVAPLDKAHLLRKWRHDWLVPGLIREKLTWMLSCLPAAQRRILSPASETVARLMTYLRPGERPLAEAVAAALSSNWGLPVRPAAWEGLRVPDAYSVRFVVFDTARRKVAAAGRDLESTLTAAGVPPSSPNAATGAPRQGASAAPAIHTSWDFGDIAPEVESVASGWKVHRYAAIKDCRSGVEIVLADTLPEAERISRDGLARLLALSLGTRAASQLRLPRPGFEAALLMQRLGYTPQTLAADILLAAVREAAVAGRQPVFTAAEFERRRALLHDGLPKAVSALAPLATEALARAAAAQTAAESGRLPQSAATGIASQLQWLVFPGFAAKIPLERLRHYPRYLDAINVRLERAPLNPAADAARQSEIDALWKRYRDLVASPDELRFADIDALVEYRWMVEEMRVSLFAQELRTPRPVSRARLDAQWRLATNFQATRDSAWSSSSGES